MAYFPGFLGFLGLLFISSLLLGTFALDSEIVEAKTGGLNATDLNETVKINLEEKWSSNGTMQAQTYNILQAGCPLGYVLANKHCHKQA
ncbi:uncharacterized protein [Drosophila takahashii]|uniref:uncharacterized protein n=1 Tax=Drosophila takahashii TaxID=29030 RepID=UPI001CF8F542|nr:uncharacterized protein LOC123002721 [Drosophila takahashii]